MHKRGISSIVTTVLIILVSVILATTLFFAGKAAIGKINQIDKNVYLEIVTSEGYTVWDNQSRLATVQIRRGQDESDAVGVDVIFSFEGNSVTHFVLDMPARNSKMVYKINLSNYPGELSSIKIIPVFIDGSLGETANEISLANIVQDDLSNLVDAGEVFETPTGVSGSVIVKEYFGGGGGGGGSATTEDDGDPDDGVIDPCVLGCSGYTEAGCSVDFCNFGNCILDQGVCVENVTDDSGGDQPQVPAPATCNNGVVESGEVCDGSDLGVFSSCSHLPGYTGGNLFCNSNCLSYNYNSCMTGDTIYAASCSFNDVEAAVLSASRGDVVVVPEGSCVWINTLSLENCVTLVGSGVDKTNLTLGAASRSLIRIAPNADSTNSNCMFRVSGFTLNGNQLDTTTGVDAGQSNSQDLVPKNIRVDNNKFIDFNRAGVTFNQDSEHSYGLIDHNIFIDCLKALNSYGWYGYSWERLPSAQESLGTQNSVYFEDNTVIFTNNYRSGATISSGHGGRWVARFNEFFIQQTDWYIQGHDVHGNNGVDLDALEATCPTGSFDYCEANTHSCCYGNRGAMVTETYNNNFYLEGADSGFKAHDIRGGTNVAFNERYIHSQGTYSGFIQIREEDGEDGPGPPLGLCEEPGPAGWYTCDDPVRDTYIFNNKNTFFGTEASVNEYSTLPQDAYVEADYNYWKYVDNFDGLSGVGVGTFSEMQSIITCTENVGFWATDQGSWNTEGEDGILFRCDDSNNWVEYYQPYTYPHPLSSVDVNVLAQPTTLGNIYFVDNAVTDCATYDPETRSCGSGTYEVFDTIQEATIIADRPGDTIYVRSGTYDERIDVGYFGHSGNSSGYISFIGYPGDTRPIMRGFQIMGREYVRVSGFEITHLNSAISNHGVFVGGGSNFIEILDNYIHHVGVHGIRLYQGSNYIVRGNEITRATCDQGEGSCGCNGYGMQGNVDAHYILSEYNHVHDIGSDFMDFIGSHSIARNNHMHTIEESVWTCLPHVDFFQPGSDGIPTNVSYHVYESNLMSDNPYSDSHVFQMRDNQNYQGVGDHNMIIRGNVAYNVGSYIQQGGGTDNIYHYNNAYHRTSTQHSNTWGAVINFNVDGGNPTVGDYVFNNIIHNANDNCPFYVDDPVTNDVNFSNNLCYLTSLDPGGLNCEYYDLGMQGCITLEDPDFIDETSNNFYIQSTSPAINNGRPITNITSPSGSGSVFNVQNADFFIDGYGVAEGDLITIAGTQTARIINITANTITLDKSVSWSTGDPVNWRNQDTNPDIGAYEYKTGTYDYDIGLTGVTDQQTVSGVVNIQASVANPENVRFVIFYIDGIPVYKDLESPYSYNWNSLGYDTNTRHFLKIEAFSLYASDILSKTDSIEVFVS
jgi:hypothetical protein